MSETAEGHDKICAICGERTDALSANPGKWPVGFFHIRSFGVLSWHHSICIAKELEFSKQIRKAITNYDSKANL